MTDHKSQVRLEGVQVTGPAQDTADRLTEAVRRVVAESVEPTETGIDTSKLRTAIARAVGEVKR